MTVKYKKHYLALQTAASDTATDGTVHLRAELHGAVLHSAAVCRSQTDHYFLKSQRERNTTMQATTCSVSIKPHHASLA